MSKITKTAAYKGAKIFVTGNFVLADRAVGCRRRFELSGFKSLLPGKQFLKELVFWADSYQEAHEGGFERSLGSVLDTAKVLPITPGGANFLMITLKYLDHDTRLTYTSLTDLLHTLSVMYSWEPLTRLLQEIAAYQANLEKEEAASYEADGSLEEQEYGKFLVALGRAMIHGDSFEDLVEHPTKSAVQRLFVAMGREGVDGAACNSLHERACGELFKRRP